jgi:hypothetical protein
MRDMIRVLLGAMLSLGIGISLFGLLLSPFCETKKKERTVFFSSGVSALVAIVSGYLLFHFNHN